MGKISDLNKAELVEYMKSTGEIHRYNSESHAWKRAFYLIKMAGHENLEHGCSKCVDKVKTWLLQ